MNSNFEKIYNESIKNPEEFWKKVADDMFWFKKPTKILNKSNPPFFKWYEDGITNTCYNALDFHIDNGRGDRTALIYDSPITGNKKKFTYKELKEKVSKFAGALQNQGVKKGDRVIIYMPMIPEAVIGMLACGRIGAIHSVVFGGFASNELASRIDDSKAKVLLTASCGFEPGRTVQYKPLVDEALKLSSHKIASKFPLLANEDISSIEFAVDIRANESTNPSIADIIGKVSLILDLQIKIRAPEILLKSILYLFSISLRDIFLLFDISKVELFGIFFNLSFNIMLDYLTDKILPIHQKFLDSMLLMK